MFELAALADLPLAVLDGAESYSVENDLGYRHYRIIYRNKLTHLNESCNLKIFFIKDEEGLSFEPHDEEVFVALVSIAAKKYQPDPTIRLSSYNELLNELGWARGGRNYEKVKKSIKRLQGVMLEIDRFWNKGLNCYESATFHLLETRKEDRTYADRKTNEITLQFSDVVFREITLGRIIEIQDYVYKKIKSPGAKKLYVILSKRLFRDYTVDIRVSYLAINMLGIHRSKAEKYMVDQITKYSKELQDAGYLELPPAFNRQVGILHVKFCRSRSRDEEERDRILAKMKSKENT